MEEKVAWKQKLNVSVLAPLAHTLFHFMMVAWECCTYERTHRHFFYQGFTWPAHYYRVQVVRMACYLPMALIGCNMERDTEMALKTGISQSSAKHQQNISLLCLSHRHMACPHAAARI